MILLLRLVIIAMSAVLSTAGLVFVVVALLAAQGLVGAPLVNHVMGGAGRARPNVTRHARPAAGSGPGE